MKTKAPLLEFINRYYLNGIANSVIWTHADGKLFTDFYTEEKNMIGHVEMDMTGSTLPEGTFGIYQTDRLRSMLALLGTEYEWTATDKHGIYISMQLRDSRHTLKYALSTMLKPVVPPVRKAAFANDIVLDSSGSSASLIIKSNVVMKADTFAITCTDGAIVNAVIGDIQAGNADLMTILLETTKATTIAPMSFVSDHFKQILGANSACTFYQISVSQQGLMELKFTDTVNKISSSYYMVKVK